MPQGVICPDRTNSAERGTFNFSTLRQAIEVGINESDQKLDSLTIDVKVVPVILVCKILSGSIVLASLLSGSDHAPHCVLFLVKKRFFNTF